MALTPDFTMNMSTHQKLILVPRLKALRVLPEALHDLKKKTGEDKNIKKSN